MREVVKFIEKQDDGQSTKYVNMELQKVDILREKSNQGYR